jgi:APA family basic amino acid/polyamine antiporter
MFKRHKREALTLRRDLGLFEATIAGVGIIVGAGIYVLIGAAAGLVGNAVWLSFIIAAFAALLTGLSYAELSSIYTDDSGEYSYVEHNFNKKIAFVTGYLVIFSLVIAAAAVSLGFAGYVIELLGRGDLLMTAVLSIILFSGVNYIGIKQSMDLNILMTVLSIVGLLVIIVLSAPNLGTINYMEMNSGIMGIFKGASLIFFAFIGFESVVKLSEETKNPRKTIPLALLLSLGISTVFYILVAFSAISVVGAEQLGQSVAPLSDVAKAVLGQDASIIISLIAIVSTGNTILLTLIANSRVLYSMSRDYPKIKFLSSININTSTPYYAVILSGLMTMGFVLIGNIELVAEITNFAVFIVFAVINLALIKSRYSKHRKEMFHGPLNFGKFPLLALLGFFVTLFMISNLSIISIIIGTAITAAGFGFYKVIAT